MTATHTRRCLADALFQTIGYLRDEDQTTDESFRADMVSGRAVGFAEAHLASGDIDCTCDSGPEVVTFGDVSVGDVISDFGGSLRMVEEIEDQGEGFALYTLGDGDGTHYATSEHSRKTVLRHETAGNVTR